jgi:serine/threonine protein kinase
MAPEAMGKQEYSPATDSWSWANTVVEILTEKVPFDGMDLLAVATSVRDSGLSPAVPAECPDWLAEILRHCWNLDPTKRPKITDIAQIIDEKLNS